MKVAKQGEIFFDGSKVYKDKDFKNIHPYGIILEPPFYQLLTRTINEDTNLLRDANTMDYSLLLAIKKCNGYQPVQSQADISQDSDHLMYVPEEIINYN